MKKAILILVILGLVLLLTSEQNLTFCKKVIGMDLNTEQIEREKFFKELSLDYYGSSEYWEELALVNKTWMLKSEQDLIIPSLKAVQRLKQKQSLYAPDFVVIKQFDLLSDNSVNSNRF